MRWNLDKHDHPHLFQMLVNNQIYIVSDGGHHHSGTYAWVLATSDTIIVQGHGVITGSLANMSSFRAEATGILHGLFAYDKLIHHVAENAPSHLPLDDLLCNGKINKHASVHCDSLSPSLLASVHRSTIPPITPP